MSTKANRDCVYVFNLSSDVNSPVLAANLEWVKAFARISKSVNVFSTHLGEIPEIENVKFFEIGGGAWSRRVIGILRLANALTSIIRNSRSAVVFHHMSPRTAVLLGPFLRFMRVPQGLWYSHSVASIELKVARHFVNYIFTSSKSAIPIVSKKLVLVGHGISTKLFKFDPDSQRKKMSISSVGRISKIKNLNSILLEISRLRSETKQNISLEFVGSVQDPNYKKELELMGSSLNLNIRFCPPLQYDALSKYYNSQSIYFTGTPKSTDKATLEAAFCGCFVVSDNADALKLTGMQLLYGSIEENELPSIPEQLERIFGLDAKSENTLRQLISDEAIRQNDVNKTVAQILNYLKGKYE